MMVSCSSLSQLGRLTNGLVQKFFFFFLKMRERESESFHTITLMLCIAPFAYATSVYTSVRTHYTQQAYNYILTYLFFLSLSLLDRIKKRSHLTQRIHQHVRYLAAISMVAAIFPIVYCGPL